MGRGPDGGPATSAERLASIATCRRARRGMSAAIRAEWLERTIRERGAEMVPTGEVGRREGH